MSCAGCFRLSDVPDHHQVGLITQSRSNSSTTHGAGAFAAAADDIAKAQTTAKAVDGIATFRDMHNALDFNNLFSSFLHSNSLLNHILSIKFNNYRIT